MAWQQTPYTVPLLLAAIVSFLLVPFVRIQVDEGAVPSGTRLFVVLAIAAGVWSGGYGLQIAAADLEGKLLWGGIAWIGVVVMSVAWPAFVLMYTNRGRWVTWRSIAALAALPTGVLALVWSRSPLVVADLALVEQAGFLVLQPVYGPVFWVFVSYTYILDLVAVAALVEAFVGSEGLYRRQAGALLVAGTVPMMAGVSYNAGIHPLGAVDPTPLTFAATTPVIAWALLRYRLLDLLPVARSRLLDETGDGIVVLDQHDRVVDLNPTVRDLLDVDSSVVGVDAETALATCPPLRDVATHPERVDGEITVVVDGERRAYDVSTTDVSTDRFSGTVVLLRDVTERRNVEQRFRTLLEKSANVITVLAPDGRIEYANPAVESTLGYDPDRITGRPFVDFVHPDDRDDLLSELSAPSGRESVEHRVRDESGSWRVFESTVDDLRTEPGIEGLVVTSHDVTDDRRYEERLQVLNRVLRHDLRTQMNVIQGRTESLLDRVSDREVRTHLETIDRKARELVELGDKARLIDDSLDAHGAFRRIDATASIEHEVESIGVETDAEIETDLPESAWIEANPLVDAAIENVLRNAIEHSGEGARIEVSIAETTVDGDDYVEIHVSDPAPSIPPHQRDVLRSRTETPLEHTDGIGLWIVNWIVSESEGDLLLRDDDDGNVVVLRRPAAAPPDRPENDPVAAVNQGKDL